MAGWDDILREIEACPNKNAVDTVRQSYVRKLEKLTGRNVIVYYSAWLNRPNANTIFNLDINDSDMNGFMNAVRSLDCTKGLDLILHTPGGSPTAAEGIVNYLWTKFNKDIRVIVPQLAMSAGTMIACAAKQIIMGKQSSLGPIDPQFNSIPAYNIVNEFEEAKEDLQKHPDNFNYWRILLSKYPAAFVKQAKDAIDLSDTLLRNWLETCMFAEDPNKDRLDHACGMLNEHKDSKEHARHFNLDFCKNSIGLNVLELESNQELQDTVLSIHHACMHTFAATPAIKIIENHIGKAYISIQK